MRRRIAALRFFAWPAGFDAHAQTVPRDDAGGRDASSLFECEETRSPASPSQPDVSSALARAHAGDCVVIPAGSATWSSTLNIPPGVVLLGAGGGWIQGSSSSSLAVGIGSRSFTIRASTKLVTSTNPTGSSAIFGFIEGETVTAHVKYDSSATMTGQVTSWNGTTLVLDVSSVSGSGTFADWTFTKEGETRITRSGGTINITKHAKSLTGLAGIELINRGSGTVINVAGRDGGAPFVILACSFVAAGGIGSLRSLQTGD